VKKVRRSLCNRQETFAKNFATKNFATALQIACEYQMKVLSLPHKYGEGTDARQKKEMLFFIIVLTSLRHHIWTEFVQPY
jgi:hypothetical protein